jgi:hypothetical protein
MSDATRVLWCLAEAGKPFPVVTSPTTHIGVLKDIIKQKSEDNSLFQRVNALNLILWKVRYF